ncbi:MAG: GGDEF domain-containing protein [Thermoleophilaceae bacterium]
MTAISGPLGRLDRSKEQLAKAWLVRVIERASLEEIRALPTDRIARELPELISDLLRVAAEAESAEGIQLSGDAIGRAAGLAALRAGGDFSAAELARDIAALQAVLLRALRDEFAGSEPQAFADAAERLAEAAGAVQAAAVEELVRTRSRELESQANTDPLTGLYNLRYLQREIAQLLDVQKRYSHPFAVLLLDIDGLKRVNDAHGHQAGDRVLMQVAMAMRRAVRSVDTAARLGGDEFCVLAPEQGSESGANLAGRLVEAIREEVVTPDNPPVGVSIGVAACPEQGEEADALLEAADQAMYRAKANGEAVAVGGSNGTKLAEQAKR